MADSVSVLGCEIKKNYQLDPMDRKSGRGHSLLHSPGQDHSSHPSEGSPDQDHSSHPSEGSPGQDHSSHPRGGSPGQDHSSHPRVEQSRPGSFFTP